MTDLVQDPFAARGDARSAERPLVTIVVPVRNGGSFLRESLDSILAQSYRPLEVIVMDDESTDGTPALLESYGDAVRVVRQAAARGIYDNANDGIELAQGEYVAVFHADDVYLPEMVEREVALLERYPEAGAAFAFVSFIDVDGREFGRLGPAPPEIPSGVPIPYPVVLNGLLRHKDSFLPTPSALVRTEIYRRLGGYRQDEYKNTSDLEMWLRIARRHPVVVLQEPLMRYRRGHGSSSERYHRARTDPERFFVILDHELDLHGGRAVALPDAVDAFEGHRAHDLIVCALNALALGDIDLARERLDGVKLGTLRSNVRIDRARQTLGLLALRALLRLPHASAARPLFRRRLG
jgi:GT2 family glycosyltransferase